MLLRLCMVGRDRARQYAALGQVQEAQELDLESILDTKLEQHKDLVQGQLENGLKYVILPNAVPPERFEAHLEICAGTDFWSTRRPITRNLCEL